MSFLFQAQFQLGSIVAVATDEREWGFEALKYSSKIEASSSTLL